MKKYRIKVPSGLEIVYSQNRNLLIVKGSLAQKSLKLKVDLAFNIKKSLIEIKPLFVKGSNKKKKNLKALQGTTVALIRQLIMESRYLCYTKLKMVGVGYRTLELEKFTDTLLFMKLGYSHRVCLKVAEKVKLFSIKRTHFFLRSSSFQELKQTAAFIRSYKKPEPYKGKGLLYDTEIITLKEGKKV